MKGQDRVHVAVVADLEQREPLVQRMRQPLEPMQRLPDVAPEVAAV